MELDKIETEEVLSCEVCGAGHYTPVANGFDYEYETCANEWQVVACKDCGFQWLNPRPLEETLSVIYPDNYYSYSLNMGINPVALWAKQRIDQKKLRGILAWGESNAIEVSYLDIGCGDGRYLRAARDAGVSDLYGLELNEAQADALSEGGFKVYTERAEDCQRFDESSLDLVTMFHVIEHVSSPRYMIRQIAHWLKNDGILALETPNIDSVDREIFKRRFWGGYHFPRHWTFFNLETLKALVEQEGFDLVDVKYNTGHSFWMFSFHHFLKYQLGWKKLSKMFDPLNSLVILSFFTGFDLVRSLLGFKTSSILIIAKKRQLEATLPKGLKQ